MSAPEVMMGYVAAHTTQIHLSSGINSLSPRKEHPVRYAERAAMLDHVTNNRYEWGTGRGAGSHEMATFNILDTDSTKSEWEEVVREIPRMWEQLDYSFQGKHFTVPTPHNILPKPYGPGHPPIWVAAGNPPTFGRAGEAGIGAIAFNFEPIFNLRNRVEAYKEGISRCTQPIGQFIHDNLMMTNGMVCLNDRKRAREVACAAGRGYLVSMVNMYHDTMPSNPNSPTWPTPPHLIPQDDETLDFLIKNGFMLCGTPEEVCEQIEAYQTVGCDQLVFGLPGEGLHHEEVLEMIEIFGAKVIPEFDRDPMHRSTRARLNAKRKYPDFAGTPPTVTTPLLPKLHLMPDNVPAR